MSDLRTKLIRLAHSKPELREHLVPILKEAEAIHPGHAILRQFLPNTADRHQFVIMASSGKWTKAWEFYEAHRDQTIPSLNYHRSKIFDFIESI